MYLGCFVVGTLAGIVRQMAGPGDLHRKFDGQVVWSGLYSGFSALSTAIPARDRYHVSVAMTICCAVVVALGGVELYNMARGLLVKAAVKMMEVDKGGDHASLGGMADGPAPGGGGGGGDGGRRPGP